jgi:hypothetical protein
VKTSRPPARPSRSWTGYQSGATPSATRRGGEMGAGRSNLRELIEVRDQRLPSSVRSRPLKCSFGRRDRTAAATAVTTGAGAACSGQRGRGVGLELNWRSAPRDCQGSTMMVAAGSAATNTAASPLQSRLHDLRGSDGEAGRPAAGGGTRGGREGRPEQPTTRGWCPAAPAERDGPPRGDAPAFVGRGASRWW